MSNNDTPRSVAEKRKYYNYLRSTLSKSDRQTWREIEFNLKNNDKLLTPNEWLQKLISFVEQVHYSNAYKAWVDFRNYDNAFWGENPDPYNDIKGYSLANNEVEKTQLLRLQLSKDINIYNSYENSMY